MNAAKVLTPLTNRKIDAYMLQGLYGTDKQDKLIEAIHTGRYKGLDARIKDGQFSDVAMHALATRPAKVPKDTQEQILAKQQAAAIATFEALGIPYDPSVSVGV